MYSKGLVYSSGWLVSGRTPLQKKKMQPERGGWRGGGGGTDKARRGGCGWKGTGEEVETNVGVMKRGKAAGCVHPVRYSARLRRQRLTPVVGRCQTGTRGEDAGLSEMFGRSVCTVWRCMTRSTIGSLKPISQRPVPLPRLKGDVKGLWPLPFMCIDPSGGGGARSSKALQHQLLYLSFTCRKQSNYLILEHLPLPPSYFPNLFFLNLFHHSLLLIIWEAVHHDLLFLFGALSTKKFSTKFILLTSFHNNSLTHLLVRFIQGKTKHPRMSDHEFVLAGVSLLHALAFMTYSGMKGKEKARRDEIPPSLFFFLSAPSQLMLLPVIDERNLQSGRQNMQYGWVQPKKTGPEHPALCCNRGLGC